MIAYNPTGLDNRIVRKQAEEALDADCIDQGQSARIKEAYPVLFYSPNIYIRIGLFLLTLVIASFSLGLLALLFVSNSDSFEPILIIAGLGSFGVLEYMLRVKRHFRSGVDDALAWMGAAMLYFGLYFTFDHMPALTQCLLAFLIAGCCSLRYADGIMTLISYAALTGILFNLALQLGTTGRVILPFLVMALAVVLYLAAVKIHDKERYRHYRSCLTVVKAASLVSFYLAGNYFVIHQLTLQLFSLPADAKISIPFDWLFWVLTLLTPIAYIYRGLQKKDSIFLWSGLALVAAAVFTIRHYYSLLPIELAMTIAGVLLIGLAYTCIRYLKTPRHGFTYKEGNGKHFMESLHIESVLIAEIAASPDGAPGANGVKFGGGSGGGGGAGGEF